MVIVKYCTLLALPNNISTRYKSFPVMFCSSIHVHVPHYAKVIQMIIVKYCTLLTLQNNKLRRYQSFPAISHSNIHVHVQHYAKVMQMIVVKYHALFLWYIGIISAIYHAFYCHFRTINQQHIRAFLRYLIPIINHHNNTYIVYCPEDISLQWCTVECLVHDFLCKWNFSPT